MQNCDAILWQPPGNLDSPDGPLHVSRLMKKLGARNRQELWQLSVKDIGRFWDVVMEDMGIEWSTPYSKTVDQSQGIEWTKWFVGGRTNIATNCVDRQAKVRPEHTALLWEGDDGEVRKISYREFSQFVSQAALALKELGVSKGDTVGILMPMVPEVVIQLFACFKIGAVAIPIFSGFGVDAISTRLTEAKAKVLFTADCSFRRGKRIDIKSVADAAAKNVPSLKKKIIFKRGDGKCAWENGTDLWWHEFVLSQSTECPSEALDAEATSLIIFTSGTTGKPKGAIHTHAGVLATVGKELRYAFNVDDTSRFFWFTDIGWMMGPWEMIGVTLFGGTLFLYEGAPDYPTAGRLWEIIERHKLTVLGISPTAIRLLMKSGDEIPEQFSLPSLKLLGSTGEPWDPESYQWYFRHVGKSRCPVINISGGTEIMGCLLSPLPCDSLKPCSLGAPGLGVDADVFDEEGKPVRGGIGHLVCKQPLPSMTKSFLNGRERYLETYFSRWKGVWYHGDWAHVDEDGHWFLHGRSDDTIKIAGKRVGPMEFEAALLSHEKISESAAIGVPDALKGETCVCYVVVKPGVSPSESLRKELFDAATRALGKSFLPKEIRFVTALPKTRSGKILRGLVRKIYLNETISDTSSVENLETLSAISHFV
jgi:acetyl-CoA synthetase